jgi:AcrR family transcriptional regulator
VVGVEGSADTTGAATDGRSLRRLRNEQAAVDAILDLLNEGHVDPTAQAVANRSGVSMRSIFRLFQDMEALNAAAIERQLSRVGPLLGPVPATGPVAERITALTEDRARFYEAIAPVRRLAVRKAAVSPTLEAGLARANQHFRKQVARVFAIELAAAAAGSTGSTGSDDLLDALDAATSWETWDRLRRAQALPPDAARQVVVLTLSALLPGEPDEADIPGGGADDD